MIKSCVVKETVKEFTKGLWLLVKILGGVCLGVFGMFSSIVAVLYTFNGKIEPNIAWMIPFGYITFAGILVGSIYECYKEAKIKCQLREEDCSGPR